MNDLERYMVKDRELLAHAMGYSHFRYGEGGDDCLQGYWCKNPDGVEVELPHPWIDANDDYAVLKWMRGHQENGAFARELQLESMWSYEIGDYARAALKVLK